MAVLVAFVAMFCACYSPNIRDCALACASTDDCVADQVCNAAHLCAVPDNACSADARASSDAARATSIDASLIVQLVVHIDGDGTLTIAPCTAACTCQQPICVLDAVIGVPATLVAIPRGDQVFGMWTGTPCAGQPATCVFTPPAPLPITVSFDKR